MSSSVKSRRKPWYSRIGPLSWYKRKWIRLNITIGNLLVLGVRVGRRHPYLQVLNRIVRRSIYGGPACTEGGMFKVWRY